jgi:hypothetical protein
LARAFELDVFFHLVLILTISLMSAYLVNDRYGLRFQPVNSLACDRQLSG